MWERIVAQRKQRAMELLELRRLARCVANKYPSQISGGQQQRAAIARALANDPKLIVGDEPTGNLDTVSAGLVFNLFEELVAQGTTIVMVTHDRDLAGQVPHVVKSAMGASCRKSIRVWSLTSKTFRGSQSGCPGVSPVYAVICCWVAHRRKSVVSLRLAARVTLTRTLIMWASSLARELPFSTLPLLLTM